MNPRRRIAGFLVLALAIAFLAARFKSKAETKVEDNFVVRWPSTTYIKNVSLKRQFLLCEIEMLDPKLVLGTSRNALIEEVTDDRGFEIDVASMPHRSAPMRYEALRYSSHFRTPPKPPRWKTVIRSVLRLPPEKRPWQQRDDVLLPSPLDINLGGVSSRTSGEEIGRVSGHFYALMAESLKYIEVPFKPSDDWVRLTPDTEIRLKEAQCTEQLCHFNIEQRPKAGDPRPTLTVQGHLPDRVVVAREFIGVDGKQTQHFLGIRRLPANVAGSKSVGGSSSRIKSVRFVIAVNPRHCTIPFVLEHIPLPKREDLFDGGQWLSGVLREP